MDLDEIKADCGHVYGIENNFLETGAPEKPLIIFKRDIQSLRTEGHHINVPLGHVGVLIEVHLGVIIGEESIEVGKDQALNRVAGYVVALNSRIRSQCEYKLIPKEQHFHQTTEFDGDVLISPAISKETLPHPNAALLWATVNEKKVQEGTLADARLTVQAVIEKMSQLVTLKKGDIVLCGSPPGAAYAKSGDLVEFGIEGILRVESMIRRSSEIRASVDAGIPARRGSVDDP